MFAKLLIFACFLISVRGEENRVAVAQLVSQTIAGTVVFTETENGVRVTGSIIGLPAGKYGFHVHELGDISTCDATGAHFDPEGNTHGGRDHEVRHVGDLGNVQFVGNGIVVAAIDFVDSIITLRGRNNIVGRALVLHEREDDLGLGGDDASLTTGNAGPRVACGVIGIKYPSGPWNSSMNVIPSFVLTVLGIVFAFIRYV